MKSPAETLAQNSDIVAQLLKTIAHPQRLKILCALATGEKTVSQLEDYCGASQSSVSQYLAKMKSEGLVSFRRESQFIFYKISDVNVLKLMKSMQKIFCENT